MTEPAASSTEKAAAAFEDGTITVCVRARPINEREKKLEGMNCLLFRDRQTVTIFENGCPEDYQTLPPAEKANFDFASHTFSFDHAYHPNTEQAVLFEDMGRRVLASSFRGFNTCIFAYGQTGSGKSYCMMGPNGGRDVDHVPGLIPRLCKALFQEAEDLLGANQVEIAVAKSEGVEAHALPPLLEIQVYVSYMEIYHEKVQCLLNPQGSQLKVRQHPSLGVYVENLTEVPVNSEAQVLELMHAGTENRQIASTKMNDTSSRSHAIFALQLIQKRKSTTKNGASKVTELRSKVNLVDLAGSERAKQTGAEGDTLKEGAQINKSLTMLGIVISALADGSKSAAARRRHIPYRDSTLTFLLKESLGGNSKTFMLSTLSPAQTNYDETLSTLRYADRAKSIVTRAFINETAGDKRIRELEDEVIRLRNRIRALQENEEKQHAPLTLFPSPTVVQQTSVSEGEGSDRFLPSNPLEDVETSSSVRTEDEYPTLRASPGSGFFSEHDVDMLESELRRSEEIIKQLTSTEVEREHEVAKILAQYKAQCTVRLNRRDPYLLNMDGAGDWIVAHLVGTVVKLGAPTEGNPRRATPLEADEETQNESENGAQYITVPVDYPERIGDPHCILIPCPNGAFSLRPLGDNRTYLNERVESLANEELLQNGDVITLGADGPQFKFIDPSAPPLTARHRRLPSTNSIKRDPHGVMENDAGADSNLCSEEADQDLVLDASERGDPVPSSDLPALGPEREKSPTDGEDYMEDSDLDFDDEESIQQDTVTPQSVRPVATGMPPSIPALQLGNLVKRSDRPTPQLHALSIATTKPTANIEGYPGNPAHATRLLPDFPQQIDPFRNHLDPVDIGCVRSNSEVLPTGSTLPAASARNGEAGIHQGRVLGFSSGNSDCPSGYTASTPTRFIGRHNLVFIGPAACGKTYFRMNLKRPDRWFSFLTAEKLNPLPTWGVDRSVMNVEGPEDMKLLLTELSGRSCFTLLQDYLPARRVTYVLCFSMRANPTLQLFRQALEFILCKSDYRDSSVVLVGTHLDHCCISDVRLYRVLEDLEQQVHNFFQLLQPNAELRPVIVGRFAVDNVTRRVFSAGFARVKTFPQLLHWFSDHALQRCKNDLEFLNGRVPISCERLAAMVAQVKQSGKWCLSSTDYKARARAVDSVYQSVACLHTHTQLLAHWGYLEHLFRHAALRSQVFVDMVWFTRLITCIACCGASSSDRPDEVMICSLNIMKRFDTSVLPFNPEAVILADGYGLLSKGVMTTRVLSDLVWPLQRENIGQRPTLVGIVNFLQMCDYAVRGSYLCYSGTDVGGPSGQADTSSDVESFLLIPTTFVASAPSSVVLYLTKLLTGPFYRFTFNMVPPHFFAKLTCRVAKKDHHVYLGPVQRWVVDRDGPDFPLDMTMEDGASPAEKGKSTASATNSATVPGVQHFWNSALWLLGRSGCRALLRMVHHSLFIAFFQADVADPTGEGSLFFDTLLRTVRDIVEEFPGAHCQEGLLCARVYEDVDSETQAVFSPLVPIHDREEAGSYARCYYRAVDSNINSLEKIRGREQAALLTARSRVSGLGGMRETETEDDIIPYLRPVEQRVDIQGFLEILHNTKWVAERNRNTLERVFVALNLTKAEVASSRNMDATAEALASTMDAVVDALAHV